MLRMLSFEQNRLLKAGFWGDKNPHNLLVGVVQTTHEKNKSKKHCRLTNYGSITMV